MHERSSLGNDYSLKRMSRQIVRPISIGYPFGIGLRDGSRFLTAVDQLRRADTGHDVVDVSNGLIAPDNKKEGRP